MIKSAIMEAIDLVVERRSRAGREARGIWYHGTQPKNLKTILSNGLKADWKNKNWDADPDASRIQVDRTSYGGIYVTSNLMTALSSTTRGGSKDSGSGSLIVVMELQPKSLTADEDSFTTWMASVPVEGMRWGGNAAALLWFGMMNMSIPDEIDIEAMTKDEYNNYTRARDNRRLYNETWEAYRDRFYNNYRAFNKGAKASEQQKKFAEPVLREAFHAAIKRMAGYFPEEYGKWWKSEWHRQYSVVDPKAKEADLPEPPDPKEGEADFRNAVDKITKIFKAPVTREIYSKTGRSLEDIKFSGSNRIIAIVEVNTKNSGPHKLIVHYGTPPADFFQQWDQRWGSKLYVVDRNGNRLPQYDKYDTVIQEMENKVEESNDALLGKLRQRLHMASGKEKNTIRRAIDHLESKKKPKKGASEIQGLQVTRHDQVDPDVIMWVYQQHGGTCDTFILVPKGEYGGIKVPRDTFIQDDGILTHATITRRFLKDVASKSGERNTGISLLDQCYDIVGKTPLSGRRYDQIVAIWGNKPSSSDLKHIRENFPDVKKVYYNDRSLISNPASMADKIDIKSIIAEARNVKRIGWKIVASDSKGGAVSLYDKNVPVDLKVGSITKNTYLGTSPEYVNMFFRAASEPEDAQDILLKFEYDESDIITGDPDFQNGEVKVKKAKLASVHFLPRLFDDEDADDIRRHLGESTTSDFADYLEPKGQSKSVGKEAGKFNKNGMSKFISPYGSYRYVHAIDGRIVGALQIMSRDGRNGSIANVVVMPEHRRKGIAKALLTKAKKDFDQINHSEDLSELGKAWKSGLNENQGPCWSEGIQAHASGDTMWIDMIQVSKKDRGKGLGRKEYEEWESKLPKNIKRVKLMAADTGDGSSEGFWDKMGFDFVYTADDPSSIPYEYRQEMHKGVNGHPTPKPIDWDNYTENAATISDGIMNDGYQEIEFVCWNKEFPEGTKLKDIKALYRNLVRWSKENPGKILPYMQDFRHESPQQISLSVVIFDRKVEKEIVKMAKKANVEVDLRQDVSDRKIGEIIRGEYPHLIHEIALATAPSRGGGGNDVDDPEDDGWDDESNDNDDPDKLLMKSAMSGDLIGVKKALALGAEYNKPHDIELTPGNWKSHDKGGNALCAAIGGGHHGVVDYLLKLGVRMKHPNYFMCASRITDKDEIFDMFQTLLDNGMKTSKDYMDVLIDYCRSSNQFKDFHIEGIEWLIKKAGSDPNAHNPSFPDVTPLVSALGSPGQTPWVEAIEKLLDLGAKPTPAFFKRLKGVLKVGEGKIPAVDALKKMLVASGIIDTNEFKTENTKPNGTWSPGDKLYLNNPDLADLKSPRVNFRGPMPGDSTKAVIVMDGIQMTVPMAWLSEKPQCESVKPDVKKAFIFKDLYHGTNAKFSSFKRGRAGFIFATDDPEYAKTYGSRLYKVEVGMSKPADLDHDAEARQRAIDVFNKCNFRHDNTDLEQDEMVFNPDVDDTWELLESPVFIDEMRKFGYDGFIFGEDKEGNGGGARTYAVIDPSQIKMVEVLSEARTPARSGTGDKSGKKALVLMHVDSLDSYALQGAPFEDLGREWETAVGNFDGDVIVVTQGWHKDDNGHSDKAVDIVRRVVSSADHVIEFDENERPWGPFFKELGALLKKLGVKEVEVGGIWYNDNGKTGCATAVINDLNKRGYKVTPNMDLLGDEDDVSDMWESMVIPQDKDKRKKGDINLSSLKTNDVFNLMSDIKDDESRTLFPARGEDFDVRQHLYTSRADAMQTAGDILNMFKSLPDPIVVYRGVTNKKYLDTSGSWSLNVDVARRFAGPKGFVYTGKVKKSNVSWRDTIWRWFAHTAHSDEPESEIVVSVPSDIIDRKLVRQSFGDEDDSSDMWESMAIPQDKDKRKKAEAALKEIKDSAFRFDKFLVFEGGDVLVEIGIFRDRLRLGGITVGDKGKGLGTKVMRFLMDVADRHGVEIEGTAQPFGDGGMKKKDLKAWYKKLGLTNCSAKLRYSWAKL